MAALSEYEKERRRTLYNDRKVNGLCTGCGAVNDNGLQRCDHCIALSRAAQVRHKENRGSTKQRRRKEGVCIRCGKQSTGGKAECETCRASSHGTFKRRYEALKARGLCVHCGKEPAVSGRVDCDTCHAAHKRPPEVTRMYGLRRRKALRARILAHYGDTCACCGERELLFLEIDHIKNDGAQHRKEVPVGQFYEWLERNGYPDGYQTLCCNCNLGKHLNGGTCPHATKRMTGAHQE